MSASYFIWYRVQADAHGVVTDAETVIRAMMGRLACRSGIAGHLLKKRDEPATWMEIYQGVGDGERFERELARAVEEYDVEMFCVDRRHTECFVSGAAIPAACVTTLS